MSAERALFLSLRPRFAEMLVSGQKRVELRRVRPRARPGTLVVVYAASPRREIVGTCLVEAIGDATPEEIWRVHGPETGLRLPDFRAYFDGARRAVAITISRPHRLDPPTPLAHVRAAWLGFQPPQSFRYVPLADALDLVGSRDAGRGARDRPQPSGRALSPTAHMVYAGVPPSASEAPSAVGHHAETAAGVARPEGK